MQLINISAFCSFHIFITVGEPFKNIYPSNILEKYRKPRKTNQKPFNHRIICSVLCVRLCAHPILSDAVNLEGSVLCPVTSDAEASVWNNPLFKEELWNE